MTTSTVAVGRIFLANAAPVGASWMWTLLLEHHKDRTPHMAMLRRARQQWRHLRRAGGGNNAGALGDMLQRSCSFGSLVLVILIGTPTAHAVCASPRNICKHIDDCLQ